VRIKGRVRVGVKVLPLLLSPLLPEAALPPPPPFLLLPVNDGLHEAPRLPEGSVGAQMTAPGRRRMPGGGGRPCSMAWSG
jgi:hypothetical protein